MTDKTRTSGDKDSSKSGDDPTETTSDTMRRSRRRLIQILTAGGVVTSARLVPTEWARPVIESVSLPAHAQTTGEVIVLGNDGPILGDVPPDAERPESLIASGVETVKDLLSHLTQIARAGEDDPQADTLLECFLSGCFRIRYVKGQNNGVLFASINELSSDDSDFDDVEITRPFVDGVNGNFSGTCIDYLEGFRVDLKNDNLAELHIFTDGGKSLLPIDLIKNFSCNPAGPR